MCVWIGTSVLRHRPHLKSAEETTMLAGNALLSSVTTQWRHTVTIWSDYTAATFGTPLFHERRHRHLLPFQSIPGHSSTLTGTFSLNYCVVRTENAISLLRFGLCPEITAANRPPQHLTSICQCWSSLRPDISAAQIVDAGRVLGHQQ